MTTAVRFGWVGDGSVRRFVESQAVAFDTVPAVLVISIDSCRETAVLIEAELGRALPSRGVHALLDGATFLEWASLSGSLTGFESGDREECRTGRSESTLEVDSV